MDSDIKSAEAELPALPAPQIEEIEEEWAVLGCGCECTWSGEFD